jgi:hypothetical protein
MKMKKIVLAIAAVAVVACFASCNKKCTCKTYAAGVVVETTEDVELDKDTYKKCSDMNNIVVANPKTGMECE